MSVALTECAHPNVRQQQKKGNAPVFFYRINRFDGLDVTACGILCSPFPRAIPQKSCPGAGEGIQLRMQQRDENAHGSEGVSIAQTTPHQTDRLDARNTMP